ncbi:MAG: DUF2520 domain-containing protein [Sphingobacteriaceae bacterium]|nr:DUF2520 domain-containing protein [Sphingobacteriaceae bacterium]
MKITLLGSGNVATHLGEAFKKAGHEIVQVWSRTAKNAAVLANSLQCGYTNHISDLSAEPDIYILSVPDDSITETALKFPFPEKILVHTSGTTGLEVPGISGVFYPVQTFSKSTKLDLSLVPIAIEGKDQEVERLLLELGGSISSRVVKLNSDQRKALHVAAVFACNFSNHLYGIAERILESKELSFDLIYPLILETAVKVQGNSPASVQTGPAVRGDQKTLDKHLQFLDTNPALKELYERISQSIINFY